MSNFRRRRITYRKRPAHRKQPESASFFIIVLALMGLIYLGAATKAGTFLAEKVVQPVFERFGVFFVAESEEPSVDNSTISFTLPAFDFYFLQSGVYASQENAKTAAKTLQEQGGAGYIYQDDQDFRTIVSAYTTESDAESVKQRLSESLETKVLSIHVEEKSIEVASQEQAKTLEQAYEYCKSARNNLYEANKNIETPDACKESLNLAKQDMEQAKEIVQTAFADQDNENIQNLLSWIETCISNIDLAINAQENELNTKSQFALCSFLGELTNVINQI